MPGSLPSSSTRSCRTPSYTVTSALLAVDLADQGRPQLLCEKLGPREPSVVEILIVWMGVRVRIVGETADGTRPGRSVGSAARRWRAVASTPLVGPLLRDRL